ncbi:Epoxyqueuosine reductase [bioreactor metagenome]|uniref:Epoxyqueuosine reductase n=1 Tax=bioreactor metagenome TaxID=1076179 RepID=A0A645CGA4_9ZZZZ
MEMQASALLRETIKARANNLGFSLCGFTSIEPPANFPRYQSWIEGGFHGDMKYLASAYHLRSRQEPQSLVPWAKTLVFFAWPYALNRSHAEGSNGQVAGYACQQDYHLTLPSMLSSMMQEIQNQLTLPFQFKIFTDSAPILERELASRAGLGWIGKNSCLISPQQGSAFLLAEVFLDVELDPDPPFSTDHCGTCQRCIQACPTQCIQPDRTLDASRCISTLTIENKGEIPADLAPLLGNHLFGCDICQSVCPWNRFAPQMGQALSFTPQEMIAMLKLDEESFSVRFQDHPIRRTKLSGWLRNLCVVLGNQKVQEALDPLTRLVESSADAVVKTSAHLAIQKIKQN